MTVLGANVGERQFLGMLLQTVDTYRERTWGRRVFPFLDAIHTGCDEVIGAKLDNEASAEVYTRLDVAWGALKDGDKRGCEGHLVELFESMTTGNGPLRGAAYDEAGKVPRLAHVIKPSMNDKGNVRTVVHRTVPVSNFAVCVVLNGDPLKKQPASWADTANTFMDDFVSKPRNFKPFAEIRYNIYLKSMNKPLNLQVEQFLRPNNESLVHPLYSGTAEMAHLVLYGTSTFADLVGDNWYTRAWIIRTEREKTECGIVSAQYSGPSGIRGYELSDDTDGFILIAGSKQI